MFDVGFSEVLLIAIVALLVLGPERLPKAARFAGLWIRRARGQWDSVRNELERELAAEELKASVARARSEAAAIARGMQETEAKVQQQARTLEADMQAAVQPVMQATEATMSEPMPSTVVDDAATVTAAECVITGRAIPLEEPLPTDAVATATAAVIAAQGEKP